MATTHETHFTWNVATNTALAAIHCTTNVHNLYWNLLIVFDTFMIHYDLISIALSVVAMILSFLFYSALILFKLRVSRKHDDEDNSKMHFTDQVRWTHLFAVHSHTVPDTLYVAEIVDEPLENEADNIWQDWNRTWSEWMESDADALAIQSFRFVIMPRQRHLFPAWPPMASVILDSNLSHSGTICRLFRTMVSILTMSSSLVWSMRAQRQFQSELW